MHVLSLWNISLYGSLLYKYGRKSELFDRQWLEAGFCLQRDNNKTINKNGDYYRTTHDVCGYVIILISVLGLALQQFLSRRSKGNSSSSGGSSSSSSSCSIHTSKADALTFWALVGLLGHAFGHFLIANGIRYDFYPPPTETFMDDLLQSSVLEAIGKAVPGYFLFWMPLVSTYMMNTAKGRVAGVAFCCWIGSLFVQTRFGFSYAQSVLFAGLSIDQLLLPKSEKGFEYALWPLITTLPNGAIAWIESLSCSSSPLMKQHGHLVYDVYMAISYIVFYLICWVRTNYFVRASTKTKSL